MNSERSNRVNEIFQAALDLPTAQRSAYLHEACGEDSDLRREIESLLHSYEQSADFMERPAIESDAAVIANQLVNANIGRSIGHYRISQPIGSGGMGEVYLAIDVRTDRKVALKLLPNDLSTNRDRVQRFQQEARAALALNHPNIVTIFEIGEAEGRYFIATEWIQGGTLRQRITTKSISLSEALDIAVQIASALAAAHEEGIVHRDIKPENIMLRPDGYVKVLDFGIAKLTRVETDSSSEAATALKVKTAPGMVMGTVNYMSPEQARGLAVDQRTDTWSLGVVLYEMVAGRVPFAGETSGDVIAAILEKQPPLLARFSRDVPEALEEIVTTALAKNRDERYQTATQISAALRRLKQRLDLAAEMERTSPPTTDSTHQVTVGEIKSSSSSVSNVSSAEYLVNQVKGHKLGITLASVLIVVALAGLTFGLYKFVNRSAHATTLRVTPLTSSPTIERNVALSPDGKQVAYVWPGEKDENMDLYVKLIGAGEAPLRLTSTPGLEMSPTWSPDGAHIAFGRVDREAGSGVYIISALGGPERKLADVYGWRGGGAKPQALDWSPDGKTLAVVDKTSDDDPWGIFLISVETGDRRRLTQPTGYFGDTYVSFSPDGSRLAVVRERGGAAMHALSGVGDIYLIPVAGGAPVRLTSDEAEIFGLAWTPDGAGLVFSSDRAGGDPTLWNVPAAGGPASPIAGVGQNVFEMSIARQSGRLAFAQKSLDYNIYRVELTSQGGRRSEAGTPAKLISSTRQEVSPQFSPDGRRIAFMSDRSGNTEIWASDAQGKNVVQLTKFGGTQTETPSWSPDGRLISFVAFPDGNADIYVITADGGSPHRLTTDPSGEIEPSWSRDGQWIYFSSNRTGRYEVWKMPAAGGTAIQLTKGGGVGPVESFDGRTVYYAKGGSGVGVWQVPASGGDETQVLVRSTYAANPDSKTWAVLERGIYFLNFSLMSAEVRRPAYALEFFDFATHQTTQVAMLEGPERIFQIGALTVSPDEHWVLYAQRDKLDFDLMLVENLR